MKEPSACQQRFPRPRLKIISLWLLNELPESVCVWHWPCFWAEECKPCMDGPHCWQRAQWGHFDFAWKNQQELRLHSVEDRRFDSYNSICAYLCIDISQASDYIMEWIFNTYNDLLVNEDQNAKGRASTMAQWFSFQCLPFLCCHFCVVGSDVLPPFPSSLLFFLKTLRSPCLATWGFKSLCCRPQISR